MPWNDHGDDPMLVTVDGSSNRLNPQFRKHSLEKSEIPSGTFSESMNLPDTYRKFDPKLVMLSGSLMYLRLSRFRTQLSGKEETPFPNERLSKRVIPLNACPVMDVSDGNDNSSKPASLAFHGFESVSTFGTSMVCTQYWAPMQMFDIDVHFVRLMWRRFLDDGIGGYPALPFPYMIAVSLSNCLSASNWLQCAWLPPYLLPIYIS